MKITVSRGMVLVVGFTSFFENKYGVPIHESCHAERSAG